ncbi:hypothetical protein NIES267_67290 [Calothrix parasitica NIES-267]|uniref:Uncharacterized protein n=1 Tax=Calothrix parasitica NIES-267 TaxID=1973488 RepID=A0A1Z4M166_9CYAN|nr:hypothetical protein NIES267_67290 [Calothrix parasitica NIES-267]
MLAKITITHDIRPLSGQVVNQGITAAALNHSATPTSKVTTH